MTVHGHLKIRCTLFVRQARTLHTYVNEACRDENIDSTAHKVSSAVAFYSQVMSADYFRFQL